MPCNSDEIMLIFMYKGITTTIDSFLHSPPYNFDTIEASSMRFAGVIGALGGRSFPHYHSTYFPRLQSRS